MRGLKVMGFKGVVLGYAREVVMEHDEANRRPEKVAMNEGDISAEIENWKKGTLETVEMAGKGDFVALKYGGLGPRQSTYSRTEKD